MNKVSVIPEQFISQIFYFVFRFLTSVMMSSVRDVARGVYMTSSRTERR